MGDLKITVEHLGAYDPYPFERSGTPDVWGHGLRHAAIQGADGSTLTPDLIAGPSVGANVGHAVAVLGGLAALIFRKDKGKRNAALLVSAVGVAIGVASGK